MFKKLEDNIIMKMREENRMRGELTINKIKFIYLIKIINKIEKRWRSIKLPWKIVTLYVIN